MRKHLFADEFILQLMLFYYGDIVVKEQLCATYSLPSLLGSGRGMIV